MLFKLTLALAVMGQVAFADLSSLDDVLWHIEDRHITNQDDFVRFLQNEKRNVVPLKSTGSRQPASSKNPRLVLFHPYGRLFLAMGTIPGHPTYNGIEVIEQEEETQAVKFHVIQLRRAGGPAVRRDIGVAECIECHISLLPIWDLGNLWGQTFAPHWLAPTLHTNPRDDFRFLTQGVKEGIYGYFDVLQPREGWDETHIPEVFLSQNERMTTAVSHLVARSLAKRLASLSHSDEARRMIFTGLTFTHDDAYYSQFPSAAVAKARLGYLKADTLKETYAIAVHEHAIALKQHGDVPPVEGLKTNADVVARMRLAMEQIGQPNFLDGYTTQLPAKPGGFLGLGTPKPYRGFLLSPGGKGGADVLQLARSYYLAEVAPHLASGYVGPVPQFAANFWPLDHTPDRERRIADCRMRIAAFADAGFLDPTWFEKRLEQVR